MGEKPVHLPKAEFKLAYDTDALHLKFRVADRYVLARAKEDQGDVWKDSCVELFFTPGTDISPGYFNLEMNCGGTMLFHFQERPRKDKVIIGDDDCRRIERVHAMPKFIDPEITDEVTWTVGYRLPVALLEKYCPVIRPRPGVIWRANFYKCADESSHPHWLTWAGVDRPRPDFHRPEFFGQVEFK
ncbi:MAG: carbohydrate-binding family 9-like protein [Desulfobacterales bacterium]|nr:carbohydrate-binding family 9-like protein [Desulfobacterales bacterium]